MREIRSSKSEIRNKSEIRDPTTEACEPFESPFRLSAFGLLSDFGFRISDFAMRHQCLASCASLMIVVKELFGIRRHSLQELKFLQYPAGAFGHGA
jgi:hypothetical protein